MPGRNNNFKNWNRSHKDEVSTIYRKGADIAFTLKDRESLVVVVPVFPDGSLIMGDIYRAAMDSISIEFPSALCSLEQDPNAVAKTLADLHTQSTLSALHYIGEFTPYGGVLAVQGYLFVAYMPQPIGGRIKIPANMLSARAFGVQEITEKIAKGAIVDAGTIAALTRYMASARANGDMLDTRLIQIEVLNRSGDVVSTIRTNQPEWAYIQFQQDYTSHSASWRFKQDNASTSPTGDVLPQKSSAFLRAQMDTDEEIPSPAYAPSGAHLRATVDHEDLMSSSAHDARAPEKPQRRTFFGGSPIPGVSTSPAKASEVPAVDIPYVASAPFVSPKTNQISPAYGAEFDVTEDISIHSSKDAQPAHSEASSGVEPRSEPTIRTSYPVSDLAATQSLSAPPRPQLKASPASKGFNIPRELKPSLGALEQGINKGMTKLGSFLKRITKPEDTIEERLAERTGTSPMPHHKAYGLDDLFGEAPEAGPAFKVNKPQ